MLFYLLCFLCSTGVHDHDGAGDMSSDHLRERVCMFDQPAPLSPSSQLLNEALEPMDGETLATPVVE